MFIHGTFGVAKPAPTWELSHRPRLRQAPLLLLAPLALQARDLSKDEWVELLTSQFQQRETQTDAESQCIQILALLESQSCSMFSESHLSLNVNPRFMDTLGSTLGWTQCQP